VRFGAEAVLRALFSWVSFFIGQIGGWVMIGLTPDDEAEIRFLLAQLGDGWRKGDGAAFAAPFAEDSLYITATGARLNGRQEIAELHQQIFDGIFRGTRLGGALQRIVVAGPDVVLVQSVGGILFAGESDSTVTPNGISTTVVAKRDGAWQIVSFQNTPTGRHRKLRFLYRILKSRLRAGRNRAGSNANVAGANVAGANAGAAEMPVSTNHSRSPHRSSESPARARQSG
jgi:uncharacterized protein (TIGR02246 family)